MGLGPGERERRRDRAGTSDRRLGSARAHDAALCLEGTEAGDRPRHPLPGWRQRSSPQRGDALMRDSSLAFAPEHVALHRTAAVVLGATLVATAEQIWIRLPVTAMPMALQLRA